MPLEIPASYSDSNKLLQHMNHSIMALKSYVLTTRLIKMYFIYNLQCQNVQWQPGFHTHYAAVTTRKGSPIWQELCQDTARDTTASATGETTTTVPDKYLFGFELVTYFKYKYKYK